MARKNDIKMYLVYNEEKSVAADLLESQIIKFVNT